MGLFGPSKKEKALEIELNLAKSELNKAKEMLLPEHNDILMLKSQIEELNNNKNDIITEINLKRDVLANISKDIAEQQNIIVEKKNQLYNLETAIEMQDFGLYEPTYVFANSDLYKERLAQIRQEQKDLIKEGNACTGSVTWTVSGSAAKGTKMVKDMQKLLLRAFNVECDDVIDNVKISNFEKSKERIEKSCTQISKLGSIMSIAITNQYVDLKLDELALALDFQEKKQEEKERIKELKEQQREEAKAQKEIEEARKKLQKEQMHYKNALSSLLQQIEKDPQNTDLIEKKNALELEIEETNKAIEDVDYREANKRAGYVYIISNIGAFGENVYKIGMTRRLEPRERIDELGDASVPFNFDIHALIFTEDAPGLEAALHKAFDSRKLNKINQRREFFKVSLDEIKEEVRKNYDKTVEWTDIPEAEQYRQSIIV